MSLTSASVWILKVRHLLAGLNAILESEKILLVADTVVLISGRTIVQLKTDHDVSVGGQSAYW